MMNDEAVLSYHDVLLRKSDVELLKGTEWLNDQIIAFAFELFSREEFASANDHILLIPGAATYLLISSGACDTHPLLLPLPAHPLLCHPHPHHIAGPSMAPVILDPLDFQNKSFVFFALNNNPDATAAQGGSHWSLAIYTRAQNTLHHYDSSNGMNNHAAMSLFAAIRPLLPPNPHRPPTFLPRPDCPQQQNSYDCGSMVIALTRILCTRCTTATAAAATDALQQNVDASSVSPPTLAALRRALYAIIMQKSTTTPSM